MDDSSHPAPPESVDADPEIRNLSHCHDCERLRKVSKDGQVVSQVLVKFERTRKVAFFTHGQLELKQGERVVVETERGTGLARVISPPHRMIVAPKSLRRVIKRVGPTDTATRERRDEREMDAYRVCQARIRSHGLPMRLVGVELVQGDGKAIFYFCAERRVDFRELVRELARELHTRIEMRQIGIRDQAKMVGGMGTCGRELCCSTFLRGFDPVTLKMAKVQGLVLNPQKVSGQCGRLMCCLAYEFEQYRTARKGLPKVGARIRTPAGEGKVREVNILLGRIRVQVADPPGYHVFTSEELAAFAAGKELPRREPPAEANIDAAGEAPPRRRPEQRKENEPGGSDERTGRRRSGRGRRRGKRGSGGESGAPQRDRSESPQGRPGEKPQGGAKQTEPASKPADGERDGRRRSRRRRGRGRRRDGPGNEPPKS